MFFQSEQEPHEYKASNAYISSIAVSLSRRPLAPFQKPCAPTLSSWGAPLRRYWWAVSSYEIIIIIALVIVTAMNALKSQRAAWAGMFTVALVLHITYVDAFMSAEDLEVFTGNGAVNHNRIRVVLAGVVMVSSASCLCTMTD